MTVGAVRHLPIPEPPADACNGSSQYDLRRADVNARALPSEHTARTPRYVATSTPTVNVVEAIAPKKRPGPRGGG